MTSESGTAAVRKTFLALNGFTSENTVVPVCESSGEFEEVRNDSIAFRNLSDESRSTLCFRHESRLHCMRTRDESLRELQAIRLRSDKYETKPLLANKSGIN
jgi:hypothetical protein